MKSFRLLIVTIILPILAHTLTAQIDRYTAPVLLNTPAVFIPDEAEVTGLGGLIRVRISIDEHGEVASVEQVTGPGWTCPQVTRQDVGAMREAATKAAMLAKFKPMTHNGTPIPTSTSLNFDFPTSESTEDKTVSSDSRIVNDNDTLRARTTNMPPITGPIISAKRSDKYLASNAGTRPKVPSRVSGGVVNGKALSLVKPVWPAAARGISVTGTVSVTVLIDTNGEIFSAETVSGHPLFRFAAVSAACQSKFAPVTLGTGERVQVHGVILYNFVQ